MRLRAAGARPNAAARHAPAHLAAALCRTGLGEDRDGRAVQGEMLEARVRALERASPSKTRYYDSDESSEEEEFFYTRTPYTTKKLPPLDTLPARSLSAALRRGRPLKREDYARQSLWQMLKL